MKATPVCWVGLIAESSYKLKNAQLLTNQSGYKVGNVFVILNLREFLIFTLFYMKKIFECKVTSFMM